MTMKRFPILAGTAAALLFAACEKQGSASSAPAAPAAPAVDESKAAVEAFKTEMEGVKTWMEEKGKALDKNPMGMLTLTKQLADKMQAVKTDKLPADLKEAFADFTGIVGEMGAIFKDAPEKAEEMLPFMMKLGQDPNFRTKMEKIGKAGDAAAAKLKEIGAKYGVEGLDLKPGGGGGASNEDPAPAPAPAEGGNN
jgi:hypothetical protein